MNILWLSHFVPYPPKGGCFQRSYNLLKEAARENDVYLIALKNKASTHPLSEMDMAKTELGKFCRQVHLIDISSHISGVSLYILAMKSLLQGIPLSVSMFRFVELRHCIKQVSDNVRFDVVHYDTISLAEYFHDAGDVLRVLNHHGVESFMMNRRIVNEPNPLKKLYFLIESRRLRRYEEEYCDKFHLNIAVSELDMSMFKQIAPSARFEVVENGVDIRYFEPRNDNSIKDRLIFAGRLDQYSNRDAILHFCASVWPLVRDTIPEMSFTIIGSNPPPHLIEIAKNDRRIDLLGYVDDVRPHFARAMAMVCPIRDGGGTRVKILDAMAMGMPIISTTIACEGIHVVPGVDLLIADTPAEFNEKIREVYKNDTLRATLGARARAKAEEIYSWDIIGKKLNASLCRARDAAYPTSLK
jgi:glycosyltransferase involved in cell wall biosynthesis